VKKPAAEIAKDKQPEGVPSPREITDAAARAKAGKAQE
jgi:hypothetical protein